MSQHLYPVPQRQVGPEVGKTLQYRIDKFGLKRGEQPKPIPPDIKG